MSSRTEVLRLFKRKKKHFLLVVAIKLKGIEYETDDCLRFGGLCRVVQSVGGHANGIEHVENFLILLTAL